MSPVAVGDELAFPGTFYQPGCASLNFEKSWALHQAAPSALAPAAPAARPACCKRPWSIVLVRRGLLGSDLGWDWPCGHGWVCEKLMHCCVFGTSKYRLRRLDHLVSGYGTFVYNIYIYICITYDMYICI